MELLRLDASQVIFIILACFFLSFQVQPVDNKVELFQDMLV